jgi:DNA-binding transcriptional LysR family regulator
MAFMSFLTMASAKASEFAKYGESRSVKRWKAWLLTIKELTGLPVVVFRIGELADSSLIARELAPYQLVLCAAPSYLERSPPIRTPFDLSAHDGEAMLAVAIAGMGIMLQSLELVRAELDAGRLVRVLPAYSSPTRPVHILYAPDRRLTPKLRSFIDFAVATFGREASR